MHEIEANVNLVGDWATCSKYDNRSRFTEMELVLGPLHMSSKSGVPFMLTSPNREAKSQLLSRNKLSKYGLNSLILIILC